MTLTDCWAVHWPDNTAEPIWLFRDELSAKGFARTIADPTTVSYEPILSPEAAREHITQRRRPDPVTA